MPIAEAGVLPALATLVHVRTEDEQMETYAALCVANMAGSEPLRTRVMDSNALQPLATLLLLGTDQIKVQIEGLSFEASLRVLIAEAGA